MTASERRKKIISLIKESDTPLSGGALGRETGVSRQVVVQDIAILRSEGCPITATARGYVLDGQSRCSRLFKVHHTNERTEEELTLIVDLGGCVQDVMVNHKIYGKMSAPLNVKNRRDVQTFIRNIESGKSVPLLNVTSGYHFHRISADTPEILDEIEAALSEKGFLAELMPYEKDEL
ncbi:MAG: transcription repressor NadR [Clostridiales bacterium]|nr:transcription repressor NadR [Clostridiales bacterium]